MQEIEVALKIVKDRYRPIVDNQQELICIFDKNLIIQHINEAYCKYFKKEYIELVGKSFLELLPAEEHSFIIKKLSGITPKDGAITTIHKVNTDNKQTCWQEWKDIAVFDDNGAIIEFQSIGRDITDVTEER